MPEWLRQPADRIRKATEIAGAHRDNLLLLLKGVLAATAAWFIADTLIGAPSPTFAPFAALLTVQATISGSLKDGMRFAAAMVCGVTLATLVTTLMGTSTASFAGLVLLASALGRWRRLAPQGTQVAVSALFAFAAFLQSDSSTIDLYNVASMVGLALLGCCLGAVTNMVVVPPLRYRSAEYGISTLSRFMAALLMDISKGLRSGSPTSARRKGGSNAPKTTRDWWLKPAPESKGSPRKCGSTRDDYSNTVRAHMTGTALSSTPWTARAARCSRSPEL